VSVVAKGMRVRATAVVVAKTYHYADISKRTLTQAWASLVSQATKFMAEVDRSQ